MFPGALQIFQNALQSGDQESAKKFIRDLNIAWASKSVEVDLATLSKDNLSTSLVLEDIYSQPQAGIPFRVLLHFQLERTDDYLQKILEKMILK